MSQKASAVTRAQQSEVQPHQPGQEVFKTILSEDVDWKPFPAFPPSVRLAVVVGQPSEPGRVLPVGEIGTLSDLDNVTVRIADVAANLAVLGYRLRDELGSSTFP